MGGIDAAMRFEPLPCDQAARGALVAAALSVLSLVPFGAAASLPVSGATFFLVLCGLAIGIAAAHVAYRTLLCRTLTYWVDRNAITITWLGGRYVAPLPTIAQIVVGADDQGPGPWWTWPAPYLTDLRGGPEQRVISLATRPLPEQILLVTTAGIIGVSPMQAEAFVQALQERYRLGPTQFLRPGHQRAFITAWAIWDDPLSRGLLAAGLAGALALFGWLSFAYPALPAQVALHYNFQGEVDRIGPRAGLLALPVIGLLTWTANTLFGSLVHRQQRFGAYLLWVGTLVVQILAAIALAGLLRG